MGIRGEVFSTKVSLQNRTYFFNVKENRMGELYLNIVESKNRDEGGFERQSVILFAEDLQDFLQGFEESLKVLEKAVREKRQGKRTADKVTRDGTSRDRPPRDRVSRDRPLRDKPPRSSPPRDRFPSDRPPRERGSSDRPPRDRTSMGERKPRERAFSRDSDYNPRSTERRERPSRERPFNERSPRDSYKSDRPPRERQTRERPSKERPSRERKSKDSSPKKRVVVKKR